jgi:hypothetical protein
MGQSLLVELEKTEASEKDRLGAKEAGAHGLSCFI